MMPVPVTLDLGYHFHFTEWLSFMPCVNAGYTYMDIKYTTLNEDKTKSTYEPFLRGGAMLGFESDYFYFGAGGDYGCIYEDSGPKSFYEVYVRTGGVV